MAITVTCPGCGQPVQIANPSTGWGSCNRCNVMFDFSPPLQPPQKVCSICGVDVSQMKRTKDSAGRYYCQRCWSKAHSNSDPGSSGTLPAINGDPQGQPGSPPPPLQSGRYTNAIREEVLREFEAKKSSGWSDGQIIALILGVVGGLALLIGCVLWVQGWRQQRNVDRVVALKQQADAQLANGQWNEAAAEYKELLELARDRKLEAKLPQGHLESAKEALEKANAKAAEVAATKQTEELRRLQEAQQAAASRSGEEGHKAKSDSGDDGTLNIVIIVVISLIAICIVLYVVFHGQCLHCGRLWAAVPISAELLDRFLTTETVQRTDRHYDSHYQYAGSTEREEGVVRTVELRLVTYQCRYCGYQWNCTERSSQ